ncbi:hypothetical protein H9P43_002519 [Blastocladiella emersonii ATCC 22665]|nr:hypothetical protein H9P43_002519 [Blastocladiella emersonii ATCC 22665]
MSSTPVPLVAATASDPVSAAEDRAPASPSLERKDAILAQLLGRGVELGTAQAAIECTNGESLDAALALLLEQQVALPPSAGGDVVAEPRAASTLLPPPPPALPPADAPVSSPSDPAAGPSPADDAQATPSPPSSLPRPIKSILKTNPANGFFAGGTAGASGAGGPGSPPGQGLLGGALAAATSTFSLKTSEWLKRNLSIDVQVAAVSLSTSIRSLLPASPPAAFDGDEEETTVNGIPASWLAIAADPDSRIPLIHTDLFDQADAAARRRRRREARREARRVRQAQDAAYNPFGTAAGSDRPAAADASPAGSSSSPVVQFASLDATSGRTAVVASDTSDLEDDEEADDDDDLPLGLRRGSAHTKRVRFVLPEGAAGTSPTSEHPLPGTGMVVVEPEIPGVSKGLYTAREVIQSYMAACNDRRTRPLKAVMDSLVPHVSGSGDTAPTTLVVQHMQLRRPDLLALGGILELEFGLLDLRLVNVSLTNDVARYLLALLYKVDSCPSISLAENPDLTRPMPVPGAIIPPTPAPTANNNNAIRRRSSLSSLSGYFSSAAGGAAPPAATAPPAPPANVPFNTSSPAANVLPYPPLLPPFTYTIGAFIKKSAALRSLDLSGIPLGIGPSGDIAPLAEALAEGPDGLGATLQVLTLDRCKLTTEALQVLCPGVLRSNLSSLSLRGNCIDPMGAAVIAGIFIQNELPAPIPPVVAEEVAATEEVALLADIGDESGMVSIPLTTMSSATASSAAQAVTSASAASPTPSDATSMVTPPPTPPLAAAPTTAAAAAATSGSTRTASEKALVRMSTDSSLSFASTTSSTAGYRHDPLWRDVVMGKRARGVVVLDLSDNSIKSGVRVLGEAMAHAGHLKHLLLGNNAVQGAHFAAFAATMARNTSLELLDVSLNDFSADGRDVEAMTALAAWLAADACPVKCLSVAKSGLGTAALIALSNGLVRNRSLERLNVAANRMELGAYMALAQALLAHPRVTRVELGATPEALDVQKRAFADDLARICARNAAVIARETHLASMRDALDRAWMAVHSLAAGLGVALAEDGSVVEPPAPEATPPVTAALQEAETSSLPPQSADPAPPRAATPTAADDDDDDVPVATLQFGSAMTPDSPPRGPSPPRRQSMSGERMQAVVSRCLEFRATLNEYIMSQDECDHAFMDQVLHWNDTFAELLARS